MAVTKNDKHKDYARYAVHCLGAAPALTAEKDRAINREMAARRSKGQIVQLQRRQSLAIAKDEVVELDKGVVGFALRASRLGGARLGAQGSAGDSSFRHALSSKVADHALGYRGW
jgi:hypothetical protein